MCFSQVAWLIIFLLCIVLNNNTVSTAFVHNELCGSPSWQANCTEFIYAITAEYYFVKLCTSTTTSKNYNGGHFTLLYWIHTIMSEKNMPKFESRICCERRETDWGDCCGCRCYCWLKHYSNVTWVNHLWMHWLGLLSGCHPNS